MNTIEEAKEYFFQLQLDLQAFANARNLFLYDSATAAPIGSAAARGKTLGALEGMRHKRFNSEETKRCIDYLCEHKDELNVREKRMLQIFQRQSMRMERIPEKIYASYQALTAEAYSVWSIAKNQNDFTMLQPYLEKIFAMQREFAAYTAPDQAPYDTCLEQYEAGLTSQTCDALFEALRKKIVPLIEEIRNQPQPPIVVSENAYPKEKQIEFASYLMEVMKVDRRHCTLAESEHPGTTSFTKSDLRVTTRYKLDDFSFAMAMVMHESGHALYEMHTQDEDAFTMLGTFASMSLHESQSRFYENLIGKSKEFIEFITPELKRRFSDKLADFSTDDIYRAVNQVSLTPIRMEADELSYAIHIMIRYELEKALINDQMKVNDLQEAWNSLYKKYLGIEVRNDKEGVLQDCHWAYGSIGYFPTYALGNAYGAQMLRTMKKSMDVYSLVREGKLQPINDWLKEAVWKQGARYDSQELIQRVCKEKFDAGVYADYLEDKFKVLYKL